MCVNAALEGLQRRTEMTERMQQQEVQMKESRWVRRSRKDGSSQKGENRAEMKKKKKRD